MKKLFKSMLVIMVLLLTLTACAKPQESKPNQEENNSTVPVKHTYTDMINRTVEITGTPDRIVCIGAGALRLYSYIGDMTKLVGAEDIDRDPLSNKRVSVRPYQVANKELLAKLPSCGVGGPQAQKPEAEKILACRPNLVVSLMKDPQAINALALQIKVPVLVLDYGKTECFDEKLYKSITLLGDVLDRETRAKEVVDYVKGINKELQTKTKDIKEETKPSIYLGCHANWGSKGFFSSTTNYSIFNASNIKNILDVALGKDKGYIKEVDREILTKTHNPDKVILDASGLKLMKTEYADVNNASVINSINAFKNGEVYLQLPYNAYYTNIEIGCLDAYNAAKVSYPEQFKDLDIEAKGKEMFIFFFGKDCYNEYITKLGYNFGKVDLAKEFPNYAK